MTTTTTTVVAPQTLDLADASQAPALGLPECVVIGSRRSPLAVAQADLLAARVSHFYPKIDTSVTKVATLGDQVQTQALYTFGGKAVWTSELEALLADKSVHLLAHSLKDMPTLLPEDFELGCILEREGMYSRASQLCRARIRTIFEKDVEKKKQTVESAGRAPT